MNRENWAIIIRNSLTNLGCMMVACLVVLPAGAQYYQDTYPGAQNPYQSGPWYTPGQGWNQGGEAGRRQGHPYANSTANLQYDERDAERILREQVERTQTQYSAEEERRRSHPQLYDDYSLPSTNSQGHVGRVMAEAQRISQTLAKKNGKAFVVIDKRNFQFYLYNRDGKLLRIGPVAIGKGRTSVGAFETPVGIFPIRSKVPVDDWIRPDWYFIEEGEPIPQRWEDRRVPGFFRYKLVFDGTRYIHYAEATGGRLTHGCLGLDWQDAEAVFHTLDVGSYCIIVDAPFLTRLAKGEFPIRTAAAKPVRTETEEKASPAESERNRATVASQSDGAQERVFRSLW
ncbi:MAG: L,D-transpeptidase [Desulfomonilaceae bacterium]|nr:L,D-transpeptidase [Desulfomonilaceae bacterium]